MSSEKNVRDERQRCGTIADRSWQMSQKDWVMAMVAIIGLFLTMGAMAARGFVFAAEQHERLAYLEANDRRHDQQIEDNMDRCEERLTEIRADLRDLNTKLDRLIERSMN